MFQQKCLKILKNIESKEHINRKIIDAKNIKIRMTATTVILIIFVNLQWDTPPLIPPPMQKKSLPVLEENNRSLGKL